MVGLVELRPPGDRAVGRGVGGLEVYVLPAEPPDRADAVPGVPREVAGEPEGDGEARGCPTEGEEALLRGYTYRFGFLAR